ncbi:MAG TPA: sugar nucleotide-binding protein, partial [Alphaproteobacteria bacterium]|nr:sugar nucleotide-binding protein [Alphaproteobacteria bacterium]
VMMVCAHVATGGRNWGTYHFAAAGRASWHEFAETIIAWSAPRTGRRPQVKPITTAEYPTPARRPANSVLACGRIGDAFGIAPRPWREGLREALEVLLSQSEGR